MDDIASKLSQILGSPEGMEQLRSVAASLGLTDNSGSNSQQNNSNNSNNNNNNPFNNINTNNASNMGGNNSGNNGGLDLSAITSLLSGLGGGTSNQSNVPASPLPNIDINTIMKLQQAMSQLSAVDKNVDLLLALKPHFGSERQKKVDDAIRIMQLVKLLPVIKDSGIFGGGLF